MGGWGAWHAAVHGVTTDRQNNNTYRYMKWNLESSADQGGNLRQTISSSQVIS